MVLCIFLSALVGFRLNAKLKQLEQRPNVTRGKKTNNPDQIKNQPRPEKENQTENALVLATGLTNKIKKVEEMMKALQNKESESYPCVFLSLIHI